MASKFRQDMPPPGGYGPIEWARVFPKRRFGGYTIFGLFIGTTTLGWCLYNWERRIKTVYEIEMSDGRIALEPLLQAEQERMFLKQLKQNRDAENELMKNVPGWETGTANGKPVYHNLSKRFPVIHPEEYYVHNKYKDMYDRIFEKRRH